jgi:hypothetical protein
MSDVCNANTSYMKYYVGIKELPSPKQVQDTGNGTEFV